MHEARKGKKTKQKRNEGREKGTREKGTGRKKEGKVKCWKEGAQGCIREANSDEKQMRVGKKTHGKRPQVKRRETLALDARREMD